MRAGEAEARRLADEDIIGMKLILSWKRTHHLE
jgi:hypothetical protein